MLSRTDMYSTRVAEAVEKMARLGALLRDEREELLARGREGVRRLPDEVGLDAATLSQVFQNLLSNAIGYAPGGRVTVAARSLEGVGGRVLKRRLA